MDYAQNTRMSSAKPLNTHTAPLTIEQAQTLRGILAGEGYEFEERPYMLYFARGPKLTVAVYEKGPKAVIQGKGIEDFILFTLEPRVLGEASFGQEEEQNPELFEPHFGIDESGKGDLFGPLVIAGVYVNPEIARKLHDAEIGRARLNSSHSSVSRMPSSA